MKKIKCKSHEKLEKNTNSEGNYNYVQYESRAEVIEELFNKKFKFNYQENWCLPFLEQLYVEERWCIEKLQNMKAELNLVKSQLNEYDLQEWSLHTKLRDRAGFIFKELRKHINPELLTQAWCKFYECLCQFPVLCENVITSKILNSVHLCEAPGAFISALNHFLASNYPDIKWNWLANSLNPEYEGNDLSHMIPDKRLMKYTRDHWVFGLDRTGDVTKYYNYEDIKKEAEKLGNVLLVTADGSVDCMSNPGEQESLVEHLHFCEVVLALSILAKGGSFVFKIFTMFESSTICLLYLLNNLFQSVNVYKPCTSKSGNSEVYVICLEYKGKEMFAPILKVLLNYYKEPNPSISMFPLEVIPENFLSQIEECSAYFMHKQIKTINDNVFFYKAMNPKERRKNDFFKYEIANYFLQAYSLKRIEECNKLGTVFENSIPINNDTLFLTTYIAHKVEELTIEIGKHIAKVMYSEFCDPELLKQFYSNDSNTINSDKFMLFCKLNEIDINIESILKLHIHYNMDNDVYSVNMFNDIYNFLNSLSTDDDIMITAALYLTRFEASLIYLIISAFSSVRFLNGVIVLHTCTVQIKQVLQLLEIVKQKLTNLDEMYDFKPAILNILPSHLLVNGPFFEHIKTYNNSLLQFYLSQ